MIDLTYPEGALGAEAEAHLPDRLTAALLRHEGAPDNERTRAMTWVFLHPTEAGRICVGGQPAPLPVYRAVITVPAGTLLHGPGPVGASARRNLVEEITDAVLAAEATPTTPADRARVYCLVQEVADGHWGALGTTIRMEDIASIASAELETPLGRQAREAIEGLLTARAGAA
jgi:phenylpyruvate tautomerase PptA (4-oxalocrotonate tautomerase family)